MIGRVATPRAMRQASAAREAVDLRARGLRLTKPRRAILEAVRATTAHPSAAVVHRSVQRRLPRVSLATVYRNLRTLAAEGLLRERADLTGMRFDANMVPHDHFTCVQCRRIYDLPTLPATALRNRVASATGFMIQEHRLEFYGRCPACRASSKKARPPRRCR